MNAIARLTQMAVLGERAAAELVWTVPNINWREDADAVDALYQAAKEPTREYECAHGHRWVMKDGNAKQCPGCGTITFMLVLPRSDDALAAAVRRIEGTP